MPSTYCDGGRAPVRGVEGDAHGVERCLTEAGIAFLFAAAFHPSMAHAGPVRRELRVPTAFNFLGPLTNPARPFAQAIGCSDVRMLPLMAEVLARRGTRAKLFRGEDGLDELTTTGLSTVYDVRDGQVRETHLDPTSLGLPRASLDDLQGGDAPTSAAIAREVLAGTPGPKRDIVLLNAAATLEAAEKAPTLADGLAIAAASIDTGAAQAKLESWIAASNR
jgi:anthranilate phosphoribosyltransferase